jgi:serine/threonine protein kinase
MDTACIASAGSLSWLLHAVAEVPLANAPRLPGDRVGRYRLGERLGRGGFGVVFEAVDATSGRAVALKLLRASDDAAAAFAFAREAALLARLAHPNIVALYDHGVDGDTPFLVLERLRGEGLDARLARAPLAPTDVIAIAVEVARGLAHAHAAGVVHADLKPANVFLCDDGAVKLLDFGLAQLRGDDGAPAATGSSGGTPAYMAPEQFCGARPSCPSDVFAMGVLVYQLLAGARPLAEGGRGLIEGGVAPSLRGAELPRGLAALVARALERDAGARFADGGELLAALEAVQRAAAPSRARRAARAIGARVRAWLTGTPAPSSGARRDSRRAPA